MLADWDVFLTALWHSNILENFLGQSAGWQIEMYSLLPYDILTSFHGAKCRMNGTKNWRYAINKIALIHTLSDSGTLLPELKIAMRFRAEGPKGFLQSCFSIWLFNCHTASRLLGSKRFQAEVEYHPQRVKKLAWWRDTAFFLPNLVS